MILVYTKQQLVTEGVVMQIQWWMWVSGVLALLVAPLIEIKVATADTRQPVAIPQAATTMKEWMAQIEAATVRVTAITLEPVDTRLEIVLQIASGQRLAIEPEKVRSLNTTLIIDIPNARLEQPFIAENPTVDIAQVQVTQQAGNQIRVTVTGQRALPQTEVVLRTGELTYSLNPEEGEEEEVVVTGNQQRGYAVPNSSAGTRTDAPLRDVPQSIQVVPRQVIEDQGSTELGEVLRNVSGVSANGDNIRGLRANERGVSGVFIDGNRQSRFSAFDLSNIEQVEVLKGPASVLYGQGEPGGIINVVTKQPQTNPAYEVEARVGNFDFYRGTLDFTGPLNASKTSLYRLNVAYQNSGSPVDFIQDERFAIFPVLSFRLSDRTSLTLEGSYQSISRRVDPGLPEGALPLGELSTSRFLGEPDLPLTTNQAGSIGYRLEHRVDDIWTLRHQFRADFATYDEFFVGLGDLEDDRTISRSASRFQGTDQTYTARAELLGKIAIGIVKQDFLLGVEYTRRVTDSYFIDRDLSSIDLYEPNYGSFSLADFEPTEDELSPPGRNNSIGIYAQNLISVGDRVKILLGGRFDWIRDFGFNFSGGEQKVTNFSPRVGLVYQPIQPLSLYANYARSFSPQFGIDREGDRFIPITGEQVEIGAKAEFLNGRLSATLSAYQITRANDFVPDPVDDNFEIQIGESRSRGIEFDLRGEPFPGLNLIATYALIDAEITQDTAGFQGSRIPNIPRHSGSLWTVYEFQQGSLRGLGLGAGVFYADATLRDLGDSATNPSSWRTAALVYYRRDNWRVQLNIDNLFNAEYFQYSRREEPFTIRGSLTVTF